jgi:hypothetical protein
MSPAVDESGDARQEPGGPQFPCPRFKFRDCWLTVMAIHDRPRFEPMPNNAWLRSLRLRTFDVVSSGRSRLNDGERGGQTAGEGQRGNDSLRQSNHCLIPSKRDNMPSPEFPNHATAVGV